MTDQNRFLGCARNDGAEIATHSTALRAGLLAMTCGVAVTEGETRAGSPSHAAGGRIWLRLGGDFEISDSSTLRLGPG